MSAAPGSLIKSASALQLRTILDSAPEDADTDLGFETEAPQRSLVDELKDMLALRDAEIAGHADALTKAFADGEEAGRFAAREEFEDSRAEALSLLEDGIVHAAAVLADALKSFETLALQAAMQALQILVDDVGDYRKLLRAAIAQQVAALESETIIAITVSRSDFPDSSELAALEAQLVGPKRTLTLSDEMDAGSCHIALKLGTIEFDMRRSWDEISAILSARPDSEQAE